MKYELIERLGLRVDVASEAGRSVTVISADELEKVLQDARRSTNSMQDDKNPIHLELKPKDQRVSKSEIERSLKTLANISHHNLLERILEHGVRDE